MIALFIFIICLARYLQPSIMFTKDGKKRPFGFGPNIHDEQSIPPTLYPFSLLVLFITICFLKLF